MESRPCFDACDMVAPSKSAVTLPLINSSINYQILNKHFMALRKTTVALSRLQVQELYNHIP